MTSILDLNIDDANWIEFDKRKEKPQRLAILSSASDLTFRFNDVLAEELKIDKANSVRVFFAQLEDHRFLARIWPVKKGEFSVAKKTVGKGKNESVNYDVTVKFMIPKTPLRSVPVEFAVEDSGAIRVLMPPAYLPIDYSRYFKAPAQPERLDAAE